MVKDEEIKEMIKEYLKEAKKELIVRQFPKAIPWLFNPANLPIVIVGSIIVFFAVLWFGGLTIANVLQALSSPYIWGLALIITSIFKPYKTLVMWSLIMTLLIWGYQVHQEVITLTERSECQLPFIGWFICSAIFAAKFAGWAWNFIVTLFASWISIYITSFIYFQLTKGE